MFEQLKPKLAEYNIEIFAISNDSTAHQQAHCLRDNISHTLISDENLAVIRQYGVEHHKALAGTADDTMNIPKPLENTVSSGLGIYWVLQCLCLGK